ncbi:CBS domain-containing protein [Clostridium sp.]|uniref:CBS domain-containing protein n=1 Tax=Clostridium sp. TaxID=1506 RepID=UPI003464D248
MKVKEIMSKDVACLNPQDSIEKAAQLMKQHNVGSIPVCSNNTVSGIVTDRDIALRAVASGQDSGQTTVSNIMTSNPTVGNPEMDVHEAAEIMSKEQIRRLPIVENNSLVGIVSLGDISLEPILSDNAQDALKSISQPTDNQM